VDKRTFGPMLAIVVALLAVCGILALACIGGRPNLPVPNVNPAAAHLSLSRYEPVLAVANGTVDRAQWYNPANHHAGLGLFVRIQHDNGYSTEYGHLSAVTLPQFPAKLVTKIQDFARIGCILEEGGQNGQT